MKRPDTLLEVPRSITADTVNDIPISGRRPRSWLKWISSGHLLILAATIVGWDHIALLWPNSIFPEGVRIGAPVRTNGLITIADRGQTVRFERSGDLLADWNDRISW